MAGLAMLQATPPLSVHVDVNGSLFTSQYGYNAARWERPACFADYFSDGAGGRRAGPPTQIATGDAPFALHFNGPSGRYRLGWCTATSLRKCARRGQHMVDVDAGGRRVALPVYCGGAADAGADIQAARGRTLTPRVPCDDGAVNGAAAAGGAGGDLAPPVRIACSNDFCRAQPTPAVAQQ